MTDFTVITALKIILKKVMVIKFAANPDRVAVPLSGPGGKIAIFELSKTGKWF